MGYIWKFDKMETQNEHKVSLGPCLFKMNLSFSKIGFKPSVRFLLWWISTMMGIDA